MNLKQEKQKIMTFMKDRMGRKGVTKLVQDIETLKCYESTRTMVSKNEPIVTCYECRKEIKNKKLAANIRETTFFQGKPSIKKRNFCSVGCEETWVIRKVDCSTQLLKSLECWSNGLSKETIKDELQSISS